MTISTCRPHVNKSWLTCLPNRECYHCVLLGCCWCFLHGNYGKRFDASDVLLWVFIFHDATLKPCQKACARLSMILCLHQKLLESRWEVRCGKREEGHIVKTVWVVNVFMAATISNTPRFLLSNLFISKPTHDYYYCVKLVSLILWCIAESLLYVLLINFAAAATTTKISIRLSYTQSQDQQKTIFPQIFFFLSFHQGTHLSSLLVRYDKLVKTSIFLQNWFN